MTSHTSDKEQISRIYRVIECYAKEIKLPINKWATELKRQFSKEEEGKKDLQTDRQTDKWPVTIFQYP